MGKIIVKQAQVQQFQNIGGGGKPSIRQLFGRMRDPTASGWQKINAGLGLAGKAGALAGTVLTTANQLQGGQVTAPLGMGYTYAGLDPTGGMIGQSGNVTPAEQQAAVRQKDLEQSQAQGIENLTTVGLDAAALASGQQQPTQQQIDDLNALQAQQVNLRQAQLDQARAAQAAAQPTQVTNVGGGQLGPPPIQQTQQTQQTQATQVPATQATQATQANQTVQQNQVPTTDVVGGSLAATVPQGMFNQASPAPAAPAPAAPAPAAPAPAAPAPAAPAPAPAPAAPAPQPAQAAPPAPNVGVKRSLLDRANREAKFQEMSQTYRDRKRFDNELNQTFQDIGDAQVPDNSDVQLVPEPVQTTPTRDERIKSMQERIDAMPNPVPVRRTPSPPPAEELPSVADLPGNPSITAQPPKIEDLQRTPVIDTTPPPMNPADVLGFGDLQPAQKNQAIPYQAPDRTTTEGYRAKDFETTEDAYADSRNVAPMSGEELREGTGTELQNFGVNWQDTPQTYQQQSPIDAALASLNTSPNRLPVGQSRELGSGARIINQPANRNFRRTLRGGTSLPIQNAGMSFSDAEDNFADWRKDPSIRWRTEKAFVDMMFNEFGDLFHKADPHEVGSIVMGLYLDKMVR